MPASPDYTAIASSRARSSSDTTTGFGAAHRGGCGASYLAATPDSTQSTFSPSPSFAASSSCTCRSLWYNVSGDMLSKFTLWSLPNCGSGLTGAGPNTSRLCAGIY